MDNRGVKFWPIYHLSKTTQLTSHLYEPLELIWTFFSTTWCSLDLDIWKDHIKKFYFDLLQCFLGVL